MAREDLERARTWGAASGLGVALRAVALVEGGEASVDRLREAVDALEGSPARLEHARALTDYGAALRRANRRSEARDELERGLELARRCGAKPLAERARAELRIAGGRTSDPDATGVAQLTASERRVAELAAEGHSNPEIAQALFVTRKTVETHLGHVYRKLGISGRTKLASALADPAPRSGRLTRFREADSVSSPTRPPEAGRTVGRMSTTTVEWDPVVAAATAGDEGAFAQLVSRHRREIQAHAYRILGSHEDSEDLAQETFLRVWDKRESFRGRSSFRSWLYAIATNASLTARERQQRRRRHSHPAEPGSSKRSPQRKHRPRPQSSRTRRSSSRS